MRFRKKPVEIEAIQWTGKNTAEVKKWISNQPGLSDAVDEIALFIPRRAMSKTLWRCRAEDRAVDHLRHRG